MYLFPGLNQCSILGLAVDCLTGIGIADSMKNLVQDAGRIHAVTMFIRFPVSDLDRKAATKGP